MSSINGWVSEKTNNRIPTLLNSIDPDEVMFLVNTLYIKVDWEKGFVEESTGDRVFTLLNGQVIQTPTMYADRGFNTYSDDDMVAVELPYKDEGLSMYLIKPLSGDVNELISRFDEDKMSDILNNSMPERLMFTMPRFEVKYENTEVRKNLNLLGINQMFTG